MKILRIFLNFCQVLSFVPVTVQLAEIPQTFREFSSVSANQRQPSMQGELHPTKNRL